MPYLYLDESGDFDSDLANTDRNECLIGGILYKADSMSEDRAENILLQAWYTEHPGDRKKYKSSVVISKIRHATELEAKEKRALTAHIISKISKNAEIIIFENYNKTKIVDSVRTYINIMVDGIVQLMKRLSLQDEGVTLNIIAGFKKDSREEITSSPFEGYIDKQECKVLLNERLALMRAKYSDLLGELRVTFDYADDKRTNQLILCDYICNYRFTRNKPIYTECLRRDTTFREFIDAYYKEDNIFNIKGSFEDEKVENYLIDGGYAITLFDICSGVISGEKRCERVYKEFLKLPGNEQEIVLDSLKNYIHNIVNNPYMLDQAEKVIAGGEKIVQRLEMSNVSVARFKLDLLLYKLAVLDHLGKLPQMKTVLEETEKALREEIIRSENLQYYFMFYNRYAVYCMDVFDFDKAGKILEGVIGVFVDYKVVLSSLPFMKMDDESIISDQYARLMGTKAQYQLRMLQQKKNGVTYENVVWTLNESIQNFKWDRDKARQWQVRADLEALCGHYDIAMEYLCKGCNIKHWREFFHQDNIKKTFLLLHLSVFVRFLSRYNSKRDEIKKIVEAFRQKKKMFKRKGAYPEFIIAANIAEAMENLGYPIQETKSMYSVALTSDDNMLAFDLLRLVIEGGAGIDLYENSEMQGRNVEMWNKRYSKLKEEYLPKETLLFIEEITDYKNNNDLAHIRIRDIR